MHRTPAPESLIAHPNAGIKPCVAQDHEYFFVIHCGDGGGDGEAL